MTQQNLNVARQDWKTRKIEEWILKYSNGNNKVTDALQDDADGEIVVFFSGDIQRDTRDVSIHKRITRPTLEAIFKDPQIAGHLQLFPGLERENIPKEVLHKIDQSVQQDVDNLLLPPQMTILLVVSRDKIGAVNIYAKGNAVVNRSLLALTPDPDKILPDLFYYYFRMLFLQDYIKKHLISEGQAAVSTKKVRELLASFPEGQEKQERLLLRINNLLQGVRTEQALLQKNQQLMDQLLENTLREVFTKERMQQWTTKKLSELVEIQTGQEELQASQYQSYPFIQADGIDGPTAQLAVYQKDLFEPKKGLLLNLRPESLLYAPTFTSTTNWRSRVVMPYNEKTFAPPMVRCNSDLWSLTIHDTAELQLRFFFWALQVPGFTASLLQPESNPNRQNIRDTRFLQASLRYPKERAEQESISTYLDALQKQLIEMKKHHDACRVSIEQMERSILEHAFRGEI